MDHVAETNIKLLFPSIAKETWKILKGKWLKIFTLVSLPFIFVIATYAIIGISVYIWAKVSGVENFFLTIQSIFNFAPQYIWTACNITNIFALIGLVYFSLRSTIASIKFLETPQPLMHVWKGISAKNIASFFIVVIISGLIFVGGYMLLFIPFIFLVTFYINAMFANVIEGKRGMDAFVVSRQYVKGYGTTVFVNLLFVFVISAFISQLIILVPLTFKLLNIFVYMGKVSPMLGITIALLTILLVLIVLLFLKVYIFSFLYVMFKKLQALKSNTTIDFKHGRKAVKVWLVVGIVLTIIFISAQVSLEKELRSGSPYDPGMMQSDYDSPNVQ